MSSLHLANIKYESVKAIFTAIAGNDCISRAKIADITGLSLVTAGKTADALIELGILNQEKEIKGTVGRRARLLTVNKRKFAVILDLTKKSFCFSLLDLGLTTLETLEHIYHYDVLYEDNLKDFLNKTAVHIYEHYDVTDCFGIGVSLPGTYDSPTDCVPQSYIPELKNVKLHALLKQHFPSLPIYMEAIENLSALSNISSIPNYKEKNILYWFIGTETTSGAFLLRGNFLNSAPNHPCDFYNLLLPGGNTVFSALKRCKVPSEFASVLSYPIHNCIQLMAPHTILLQFEEKTESFNEIVSELKNILHINYHHRYNHLPDIICTHYQVNQSHRGMVMQLFSQWLERIIFS